MASEFSIIELSLIQLVNGSHLSENNMKAWMENVVKDESKSLKKLYFQFFIHCVQRTYEMTDENVEKFNSNLIAEIFNSKFRKQKLSLRVNLTKFFNLFFAEAFNRNLLQELLADGVEFLSTFIDHEEINGDDYTKGICYLLLTAQLSAICEYYGLKTEKNDQINQEIIFKIRNAAVFSMEVVMRAFKNGLDFKKFGLLIIEAFCNVMEKKYDVLITQEDYIVHYFYCLQIDDDSILFTAISSLNKLSAIASIKDDLITLFHHLEVIVKGADDSDISISILDVLYQLAITRESNMIVKELLNLFMNIKSIDGQRQVLYPEQRVTIYKKAFNIKDKARIILVLQMMKKFECSNYLKSLLKLISDLRLNAEGIKVVSSISVSKEILPFIKDILKILDNDGSLEQVASQLVFGIYKSNAITDETAFIKKFDQTLISAKNYELICITILDMMLEIPNAKWVPTIFGDDDLRRKSQETLINIFLETHHPLVIKKVLNFIFTVHKLCAKISSKVAFPNFTKKLYEDFLNCETQSIVADSKFAPMNGPILVKISYFFRLGINIVRDYFEYESMVIVAQKHLLNDDDPLFYHYARLQASVVTFMLIHSIAVMENKIPAENFIQFPLSIEEMTKLSGELREQLMSKLKQRDLTIFQASLLFTSIVDLLLRCKCQPTIYDKNKILFIPKPKIHNLTDIVDFVEHYVFKIDIETVSGEPMFNCRGYQLEIMEALGQLCATYSFTVDVFPFNKIFYYFMDDKYKTYMYYVMKAASLKTYFPKIIGAVISAFVLNGVSMNNAMEFFKKFNAFQQTEKKKWKFKVCEYLIDSLHLMAATANRLLIFDYMTRFIGNDLTPRLRNQLFEMVQLAVMDMKLSEQEENSLSQILDYLDTLKIESKVKK